MTMDATTKTYLISPLVPENIRTSHSPNPLPSCLHPPFPFLLSLLSHRPLFLIQPLSNLSLLRRRLIIISFPLTLWTEHNTKILTRTHAQTSLILGLGSGILALSAWQGFLFYLLGYVFVTLVLLTRQGTARTAVTEGPGHAVPGQEYATPGPKTEGIMGRTFFARWWDLWSLEFFNGLLSFVLSWTMSFALVHGMMFFFKGGWRLICSI